MARGVKVPIGTESHKNGRVVVKTERGWVRRSRVAAAAMLGRELLPTEHVHHIDGDELNDDPANLQVLTRAEHSRIHCVGNSYWLGKHHSGESRRKMSVTRKGKSTGPFSEERRRKISERLKGNKNNAGPRLPEERWQELREEARRAEERGLE